MMLLAIEWGVVGIKVAQLVLSLSILVILHELGHFIAARCFGCRVEKFYLFFDLWFSVFKKKIGDTEYGLGWLPLGGYVKISGMIDESMDKDALSLPAQPWEFRSKPAWQRLIIMIGGVAVNVVLGFVIYSGVLFVWGEDHFINKTVKNGIWVTDSLMYNIGLRNGDQIVSVHDKEVAYFDEIPKKILFGGGNSLKVLRGGEEKILDIPHDVLGLLIERRRSKAPLFLQRIPAISGSFDNYTDSSNAQKAGLKYLDKIIQVDSVPITFMDEIVTYVSTKSTEQVSLKVIRHNDTLILPTTVNNEGRLGVPVLLNSQYDSMGIFKMQHTSYSFFESIPAGIHLGISTLSEYIGQFKLILTPSTGAYKGVGGFKAMGSVFADQWDWESFWKLTALFSIVLAFMNLLPIPALDGGHVLFTLVEMITGRKPNQKFLEYAQITGMVFLLGLTLYANLNDWFGWGKGH